MSFLICLLILHAPSFITSPLKEYTVELVLQAFTTWNKDKRPQWKTTILVSNLVRVF